MRQLFDVNTSERVTVEDNEGGSGRSFGHFILERLKVSGRVEIKAVDAAAEAEEKATHNL